jgi:DNA-binding CsgD family transcriptional regulator
MAAKTDESLVDAIYEGALFGGDWNPALEHFRVAMHAKEASLCIAAPGAGPAEYDVLTTYSSRNIYTIETEEEYSLKYAPIDPKARIFASRSAGFLFNDAHWFDADFVAKSPFYQESTLPLGLRHTLDLYLCRSPRRSVFLAAMRPKYFFDQHDEQLFMHFSPHFRRAFALREQLEEAQALARRTASALDRLDYGVMVLDETGRIAFANAFAKTFVNCGCELRIVNSRLQAYSGRVQRSLEAMLAQASVGDDGMVPALRVPRDDGRHVLIWSVPLPASSPLAWRERPGVLVFMRDPDRRAPAASQDLRALYGLTETESRVALAIAGGRTLRRIAAAHGVSFGTVRAQLHSVLAKMGLHRQADLVRAVAELAPPFPPEL